MKKILVLVLFCFVGAMYWGLRPHVPLQEPVPNESFSSSNETGLTDSNRQTGPRANHAASRSAEKDKQITLAIEHLRNALHDGTEEEIEAALETLTQLAQNDQEVHQVWASFAAESDLNLLGHLARILTPHVGANAELLQKIVDLTQRGDLVEKRSAALSMLSSISDPSPELLDLVFRLSREEGAKDVQINAIQLIANWANNSPAWDELSGELIKTIDASNEAEVRRFAIQVIALHPEAKSLEVLGAMAEYMKQDPNAHNRAIAAMGLGNVSGELRQSALGHLEQAYTGEENLNTRRNIITQIARGGEEDAVAVLKRLPVHQHPLLAQDVRDYVEILETGGIGPNDVYFAKFDRDKERGTIVGSYDRAD